MREYLPCVIIYLLIGQLCSAQPKTDTAKTYHHSVGINIISAMHYITGVQRTSFPGISLLYKRDWGQNRGRVGATYLYDRFSGQSKEFRKPDTMNRLIRSGDQHFTSLSIGYERAKYYKKINFYYGVNLTGGYSSGMTEEYRIQYVDTSGTVNPQWNKIGEDLLVLKQVERFQIGLEPLFGVVIPVTDQFSVRFESMISVFYQWERHRPITRKVDFGKVPYQIQQWKIETFPLLNRIDLVFRF